MIFMGWQSLPLPAQDQATTAYNNGVAAAAKGDFDGAIAAYDQAIATNPQYGEAYEYRGQAKADKGDLDGAIQDLTKAITLNPKYAAAYYDRAGVKMQNSDLAGALADYDQSIAINPRSAQAFNNRSIVKWKQGNLEGAMADSNQAISLNPQLAEAYCNRAAIRQNKGDLSGALLDYVASVAINPNVAMPHNNLGTIKEQNGDLDGALTEYNRALEINPKLAEAFCNRGNIKKDKGDNDGALADYNQAIVLNPHLAAAYSNRGGVKGQMRDYDGAIADCTKAIAIDPNNANSYDNRGYAKTEKGDLDGAIADLNQAIALDPNLADAYFNRGVAKDCKSDHEGATADYNKAIALTPVQGSSTPSSPAAPPPEGVKRVSTGTGFFVTPTGYLLTDFHVVKGAASIRVKIGNVFLPASVVATDSVNDIAVLKVDGIHLCIPLGDSNAVLLGQTVFTVGFPKTGLQGLSPKLTKGEISSLAGIQDDPRTFQVSVPIQPGNSGGCLADESGNAIGLVESTLSTVQTVNGTGDILQNVNYATKISYARTLLGTIHDAESALLPARTAVASFTDEVKSVEDATVFIVADAAGSALPSSHLYKDSEGNTYSISELDYLRLYPIKMELDSKGKKLDLLESEFKAQTRRIDLDRQYLDNTDQQAVNNFNAEVGKHNAFGDEIERVTNAYNDAVEKFNAELKRVGTLVK
jgi:tetratricopeptide (TPR) repeat protein